MWLWGGVAAVAGILVAECAWSMLALALGLGARAVSPALFTGLQLASAVPLVWIGLGILRAPRSDATVAPDARCGVRRCAGRGVWIGAANPLALVLFLSLLPGFVPESADLADLVILPLFVSAVLASSAAGLAPWRAASGMLARAGLGWCLLVFCVGALIAIAGFVLWRIVS